MDKMKFKIPLINNKEGFPYIIIAKNSMDFYDIQIPFKGFYQEVGSAVTTLLNYGFIDINVVLYQEEIDFPTEIYGDY